MWSGDESLRNRSDYARTIFAIGRPSPILCSLGGADVVANITGSCLARLRNAIQGRPSVRRKIARFVLQAPLRATCLSMQGLAEACGTSAAAVYRLCRDLGYEGYRQFQMDLAASAAKSDDITLVEIGQGASPKTIVQRVFECHRQSLIDTQRMLDTRVLTRLARLIQCSRRVFLLGFGGSSLAARRAADALLDLGLTAVAVLDPCAEILATQNVGPGDVVIGISHSGATAPVIEAIKVARRRGACAVALTNHARSPLALASKFRLVTAMHEHRVNAAVSCPVPAQYCVLASLYFILASWHESKAIKLGNNAKGRSRHQMQTHGKEKGTCLDQVQRVRRH